MDEYGPETDPLGFIKEGKSASVDQDGFAGFNVRGKIGK